MGVATGGEKEAAVSDEDNAGVRIEFAGIVELRCWI